MKRKNTIVLAIASILVIAGLWEYSANSRSKGGWDNPPAAENNSDSVHVQLYQLKTDWSPYISSEGQLVPVSQYNCYFDGITLALHIINTEYVGILQITTKNELTGTETTSTLSVNHNLSFSSYPGMEGKITVRIRELNTDARWGGEFYIEEADLVYGYDSLGNRISRRT